jgi:hypothetical protein
MPVQDALPAPQTMPVQHVPPVQQVHYPVQDPTPPVREQPAPIDQTAVLYRPVEQRIPSRPGYEEPVHRIAPTSVPTAPAPAPPSRRGPALFAAIAAVLAATIAVVALVVVLAQRDDAGNGGDSDVPTLGGGPPPTDVRVRDYGTSVEITWTDPGQGKNSTIVTGGHPGEVLKPMGEVGPGDTRFELRGLNDQLDYCFAVVAVYGTDSFASSPQSCTSRPGPVGTD